MEKYIISIIGIVFYLTRYYILRPLETWEKRTEDVFSILDNMCLFCIFYWFWYTTPMALVALTCNIQLYTTVFLSVAVTEDYYVWLFLLIAPYKESLKIMRVYAVFRTSFIIAAGYSIFTVDRSHAKFCSTCAVAVFSIAMCTYRITVIELIYKSKSVMFTPWNLCLFMFLSPALWLVFCLLQRDVIAAVPNGFALVLGAVQLIMYPDTAVLIPSSRDPLLANHRKSKRVAAVDPKSNTSSPRS